MCPHGCGQGFLVISEYYFIGLWPNLKYERRVSEGNTKPLSLSYRLVNHSLVSPKNFALSVYKVSVCRSIPCVIPDKGRIIPVRDKANILTVRFLCHRNPGFLSNPANLVLLIRSDRHQGMRKLFLSQIV